MIECTECGSETGVYNGYHDPDENRFIRRRKCKICGHKFITVELVAETQIQGQGTYGGKRVPCSPVVAEGGERVLLKRKEHQQLRPCEVDGDKAFFHTWALDNKGINTYALIEYINGEVEKVNPERVRFTDR